MLKTVRRKFRQTTIAARLTLSFGIIITLLIAVAFVANDAMRRTDEQHRVIRDYILSRREHIYMILGEFNEYRFRLSVSFGSPVWLEDLGQRRFERSYEARELIRIHDNVYALMVAHMDLARQDPVTDAERRKTAITAMEDARYYFGRMHNQLVMHFFPGSDRTEDFGDFANYAYHVSNLLDFLLQLDVGSAADAVWRANNIINRTFSLTIFLVLAAVAVAAALAFLMTKTFTDRMREVEARVIQMQSGDMNAANEGKPNDEISRLFSDVIHVYQGREQESQLRMEKLFDATPLFIEFWNKQCQCIDCNRATLDFHGAESKEEFLANYESIVLAPDDKGRYPWGGWREHIESAFETGENRFEYVNISDDDKPKYFESFAQKIVIDGEDIVATYVQDITVQHDIEEERQRTALAEENSSAKSRFLARMSHEIRTPLTAVLGISEIQLQNPTISLSVEEAFAKIYNSANILLSLVNDILDLSRIESGKLTTANKPYEVASLVIDVVQMHLPYLGSKKIEFKVSVDENLPAFLIGDELRIRQVLNNLLSNAFKYTDSGEVELQLAPVANSGDSVVLQISIRDTGRGMKQEHLNTLTDEYSRYHEKELNLVEGTGLGMPIVYNLLQLMGGDMDIESHVGIGTHIIIHLPQNLTGNAVVGPETAANLMSVDNLSDALVKRVRFVPEPMPYGKVLVVDDIDTNLYVARGLLMFYDLQTETCTSGQEAINLVNAGNSYDIIFMDQMMPEMNGTEATKRLRNSGYTRPIIALTANALIGQADIFKQNGFDGFLSKPIQTVHLNGILNKFIRDNQTPEVIAAAKKAGKSCFGEGIDGFINNEMLRLKQDFYKAQKNTAKNIRTALSDGDAETATRYAHTLKSLAGLIKEDELARLAATAEKQLRANKSPNIDALEKRLTQTLDEISQFMSPKTGTTDCLPQEAWPGIFEKLSTLLAENDAACLTLTKELSGIPETRVLVRQIEDCNFEAALTTLETLRLVLEV
ncbi:MAG: ATP-binding protein [Defluviitaleaceae bacterium]|nr:ATP-binding protein [Defluviitaleaceae bacterium]